MRGRLALLALLLVTLARPARAEWHVGGYLGGTHTQNSFLVVEQPAQGTHLRFSPVDFSGESFKSPFYYGLRGGYFFNRHVGVEAEFIHLKVFAQVDRVVQVDGVLLGLPLSGQRPLRTIVARFSISHGVNLMMGNVVFRQDFWRKSEDKLGRVLLTTRFGVGGTIPHPESEILGAGDQHYEGGRPALQAAGGAELRLWRGLYWLGEYKYTRTRQRVRIVGGTAETLLHTHQVVTGLSYHF